MNGSLLQNFIPASSQVVEQLAKRVEFLESTLANLTHHRTHSDAVYSTGDLPLLAETATASRMLHQSIPMSHDHTMCNDHTVHASTPTPDESDIEEG